MNSLTGTPAVSKASTIIRVPKAVDSRSARYTSSGGVASVSPTITPDRW